MRWQSFVSSTFSAAIHIAIVKGMTSILTFSDNNCVSFVESLEGRDGFYDGPCTNFGDQSTSPYNSFMINTVDLGCSITIYGYDTNDQICSSDIKIVADQQKCYNSSWQYYSVDFCTPLIPSSTTLLPTSMATQTPSQVAAVSENVNVSAVAGGSVAGTLAVVAVVAAALYYYWRRHKTTKSRPDQYDDSDKYKTSGSISGSDELGVAGAVEAPWQSGRPWELAPDHIVEAPWQSQRPHEVPA